MIDERLNLRVGAVTLVLLLGAVSALLGLGGFGLGDSISIEVAFGHAGALRAGADVQIAGRVVGEVDSISLTRDGAVAAVSVETEYAGQVPRNAEIFVASKGVIGKRYIELGPPPVGIEPGPPIAAGDRLRGIDPIRLEQVILRSIDNTARFRDLLLDAAPAARQLADELARLGETLDLVEETPGRYRKLGESADRVATSLANTRELLDRSGVLSGRLGATVERSGAVFESVGAELDALGREIDRLTADLARLQRVASTRSLAALGVALDQARALSGKVAATMSSAREIWARIDRGQGTVGALLNDPEFINEAKKLGKIIKRQPWRLFGTRREP